MWPKFLEGVGDQLAQRWAATQLTPAFIFWAGGLAAWLWRGNRGPLSWSWRGGWAPLVTRFTVLATLPTAAQVALLIGALLLVTTSAVVVERFVLPTLRLLEGYWPRWLGPIRAGLVDRKRRQRTALHDRWSPLAVRVRSGRLSPDEKVEFTALDDRLRRLPAPDRVMPTRLGNILRAAEDQPEEKYGLNGVICWPRLWLLLPDGVKEELTRARTDLDTGVRVWLLSLLFVVWTVWAWWAAPAGLLAAAATYAWWILGAAEVYADLLESSYDMHRTALYEALHWPLPATPAAELQTGQQVTQYLWYGSNEASPTFTTQTAGTDSHSNEATTGASHPGARRQVGVDGRLMLALALAVSVWRCQRRSRLSTGSPIGRRHQR